MHLGNFRAHNLLHAALTSYCVTTANGRFLSHNFGGFSRALGRLLPVSREILEQYCQILRRVRRALLQTMEKSIVVFHTPREPSEFRRRSAFLLSPVLEELGRAVALSCPSQPLLPARNATVEECDVLLARLEVLVLRLDEKLHGFVFRLRDGKLH